jgi:hypothetical protein
MLAIAGNLDFSLGILAVLTAIFLLGGHRTATCRVRAFLWFSVRHDEIFFSLSYSP